MELDDSPMSRWCLETAREVTTGKCFTDILATVEDWLPKRVWIKTCGSRTRALSFQCAVNEYVCIHISYIYTLYSEIQDTFLDVRRRRQTLGSFSGQAPPSALRADESRTSLGTSCADGAELAWNCTLNSKDVERAIWRDCFASKLSLARPMWL